VPLEKNKAGVIILGASSFPDSPNFQEDTAFFEAKKRVEDYFLDQHGLALNKEDQILDLFDSEKDPNGQDVAITAFIRKIKSLEIKDLFVYYVGHGGFTAHEEAFYLAIRATRDSNPAVSSITFKSLSTTIANCASAMRTFIIIDCCFSGAAGFSFQSGDISVAAGKQLQDDFPSKGVALLCSSSKDIPSLIIKDRNITMFTEGLHLALSKGDPSISNKYLSLKQIHQLTFSYIKQMNPGKDVRPEVMSPYQPVGDIAEMPHFINFAYSDPKADILLKKREIDEEMVKNNVQVVGKLLIDFVRNFDMAEVYYEESILIGVDCFDLEEEKATLDKEIYREKRKKLYVHIMEIIRNILRQNPSLN
jgi:hypothetical protein